MNIQINQHNLNLSEHQPSESAKSYQTQLIAKSHLSGNSKALLELADKRSDNEDLFGKKQTKFKRSKQEGTALT